MHGQPFQNRTLAPWYKAFMGVSRKKRKASMETSVVLEEYIDNNDWRRKRIDAQLPQRALRIGYGRKAIMCLVLQKAKYVGRKYREKDKYS